MSTKTSKSALKTDLVTVNDVAVPTTRYFSLTIPYVSTRDGVANPKYKDAIFHARSATTALTATKQAFPWYKPRLVSGEVYYTWEPSVGRTLAVSNPFYGLVALPSSNIGLDTSTAINRASTSVRKRIKQEAYSFSGPTFLGELRESIAMIKHPCRALREGAVKYLTTLNKRKRGLNGLTRQQRKSSAKRILSDTWLEYSFGWSPLLSDVRSAAESLARWENDIRRSRVSGYGIDEKLLLELNSDLTPVAQLAVNYRHVETAECRVTYKAYLSASLRAPYGSAERLVELSGFNFSEFVPTAWELLPWSFLVDYFSNVGDVISSAMVDTSQVYAVSRSVKSSFRRRAVCELDVKQTVSNLGVHKFVAGNTDGGLYVSEKSTLVRTAGPLDYPRLEFSLPGSSKKFLNMAALYYGIRKIKPFQ